MSFSNLILNMPSDFCFHCFKNFVLRAKLPNRARSFCFLNVNRTKERSCQQTRILQMRTQSQPIPLNYRLHTVKGWKFIVKPELAENDGDEAEYDPADAPCEEGTGAVPPSVLISQLNECHTVKDQMHTLSSILSLTKEDIANRKAFCDSITEVLKPYFSDFVVHRFGSSMNGFGFKGCDMDMCFQTSFDISNKDEYIKMEVPTVEDVLDGKVLKSDVIRMPPRLLLRFIRRIIRKHCTNVREPIFLIKARTPILRFYDEKHDLFCDFSCENKSALRNTRLLHSISQFDDRIGFLVKTLRYWGKYGRFVGDIDMFNSYAFTLLVIYFLQNTTPAILPPLNDILSKADYVLFGNIQDDDLLHEELKAIPPSKNTQTIDELLKEFFYFYLYYDFGSAMLPLTSLSVQKQEFKSDEDPPTDTFELSTVCIQDPFRRSFNATSSVAYKCCKIFMGNIIDACKLYENPDIWCKSSENWGVSSILASSNPDVGKDRLFEVSKCETLKIPLKSTALNLAETCEATASATERHNQNISKCVKKILEHCLLFKCSSMYISQRGKDVEKPVLKLHCEVIHNTWSGRHLARRKQFGDKLVDNSAEVERAISTHLAKEKKSDQVIFKSVCSCFVTQKDGQTVLKLSFVLESGKIPPPVIFFLRSYIPKMFDYLL